MRPERVWCVPPLVCVGVRAIGSGARVMGLSAIGILYSWIEVQAVGILGLLWKWFGYR